MNKLLIWFYIILLMYSSSFKYSSSDSLHSFGLVLHVDIVNKTITLFQVRRKLSGQP